MIPVIPLTNEPQYDVSKEEPGLGESTIASLLERTKQKGRGAALKTLVQESQAQEKPGKHAKSESSIEEEGNSRRHRPQDDVYVDCGYFFTSLRGGQPACTR